MSKVNLERAKQLACASALAYCKTETKVRESSHFASSAFIGDGQLRFVTHPSGLDGVLVGQTSFGVVAAFRGTLLPLETDPKKAVIVALDWLNSLVADQVPVDYAPGGVHKGFHRSIESLWHDCDLLSTLQAATQGGKPLFLTGHSKGGAVATLAALRCMSSGLTPAGVMTFGCPRIGDPAFAAAYDARISNHWRFEHRNDIVPHAPMDPSLFAMGQFNPISDLLAKIKSKAGIVYRHVGNLCFLDWEDQLVEGDALALEHRRMERLLIAGPHLVFDHFYDNSFLLPRKRGYVEAVANL